MARALNRTAVLSVNLLSGIEIRPARQSACAQLPPEAVIQATLAASPGPASWTRRVRERYRV